MVGCEVGRDVWIGKIDGMIAALYPGHGVDE